MRNRMERFMYGRYGVDGLGKATMVMVMILVVLDLFFPKLPFFAIALVLLVISYFRMFSRNVSKRYAENQWFAQKFSGVTRWFQKQKSYRAIQKDYRIYNCPSCKQKVRVPKGKGKISIHCPKCGTDFIKKS